MKALHVLLMECVSCRPSLIPRPALFSFSNEKLGGAWERDYCRPTAWGSHGSILHPDTVKSSLVYIGSNGGHIVGKTIIVSIASDSNAILRMIAQAW